MTLVLVHSYADIGDDLSMSNSVTAVFLNIYKTLSRKNQTAM